MRATASEWLDAMETVEEVYSDLSPSQMEKVALEYLRAKKNDSGLLPPRIGTFVGSLLLSTGAKISCYEGSGGQWLEHDGLFVTTGEAWDALEKDWSKALETEGQCLRGKIFQALEDLRSGKLANHFG